MSGIHVINIDKDTIENDAYRKEISTHNNMQLVVMSLNPGENIPKETHAEHDQMIKVVKGSIIVKTSQQQRVPQGSLIIIPAGTEHEVINESGSVKLYTIYSPPEHKPGTLLVRQQQTGGKSKRRIY